MTIEERTKLACSYLGKTVLIEIDRPLGYIHKKESCKIIAIAFRENDVEDKLVGAPGRNELFKRRN